MVRGLANIGAESVLLVGAGRAILMQIANPAVGHGVAEHSSFAEHPLDRLRATMTYVYAVVYGTEDQLAAARRRVNRAHARVRREADSHSQGYSAFDAQSQLWVVATLYDTVVTVYEKIYGDLDEETADRVYRDYARIGTSLQLPEELWPADREAFGAYWSECLQMLGTDAVTLRLAHDLLHPPGGPLWLRIIMPPARFITAGLLPDQLREGFGLPWSARHRRRFDRTMRTFGMVYRPLPQRIRHWFKNYYLAQLETA
ncbi:DUF2236 domain-containing protein [Arthrobacter sp. ISL-48]|uniref:oxygenase MpaB family protein n=1 Tax=Arthrobacter sp. ISL-48 TaxID=2819110 RepID=UPI001BEA3F78|nr:oxygenase MpaB family protein [Arthrobacter sp. ISL-48]MBT2530971.1 DUF2236 domain-containing protein [Arthrobacter sp. ISL-48]